MFYQFDDEVTTIDIDSINPHTVTVGYVSSQELYDIYKRFGFSLSDAELCLNREGTLRSGVNVHEDYTFIQIRVTRQEAAHNDYIGIFLKKNLIIVVNVLDKNGSTRNNIIQALNHKPTTAPSQERVLYYILEALISGDAKYIEEKGYEIARLEEAMLDGSTDDNFNFSLLRIKRHLLRMHNYYEQLIDIGEAIGEDENELFGGEMKHIARFTQRLTRLKNDIDYLQDAVIHLQQAYQASLDLSLNHTMKAFTTITTVFFPLTVIVGWYGMNFRNMPELSWRYGYLFVIILSVALVSGIMFLIRHRY